MIYGDEIQELNKWFDDKERCFDTGRNEDGEYTVSSYEVDDFCDFLREMNPDLIGIQCMCNGTGIWFKLEDLERAEYI